MSGIKDAIDDFVRRWEGEIAASPCSRWRGGGDPASNKPLGFHKCHVSRSSPQPSWDLLNWGSLCGCRRLSACIRARQVGDAPGRGSGVPDSWAQRHWLSSSAGSYGRSQSASRIRWEEKYHARVACSSGNPKTGCFTSHLHAFGGQEVSSPLPDLTFAFSESAQERQSRQQPPGAGADQQQVRLAADAVLGATEGSLLLLQIPPIASALEGSGQAPAEDSGSFVLGEAVLGLPG